MNEKTKVNLEILNYIFEYYYRYEFANEKQITSDGFGNEWIEYRANYLALTDADTLLIHIYKIINTILKDNLPLMKGSVIEFVFDFVRREIVLSQNVIKVGDLAVSLNIKQDVISKAHGMLLLPTLLLFAISLSGTSTKQKDSAKVNFASTYDVNELTINSHGEVKDAFVSKTKFSSNRFNFAAKITCDDQARMKQIWDSLVINYATLCEDMQAIIKANPNLNIIFTCLNEHTPIVKTINTIKFPLES